MSRKLAWSCYALLSLINGLQNYTNPTKNVTCGRFDDCVIYCSSNTSCHNLYFVFDNDWSVTADKYNATLICDTIGSCRNSKIFGNRTSSISMDLKSSVDVHILFGNYNNGTQIANVHCNPCQLSRFYYSSVQNNVSLIKPTDGIVIHECEACGLEGNIISALNIYQLQFKLNRKHAIQSSVTIYAPMHNNFDQSFLFQSVPDGIIEYQHLFLYFMNGLFGKKFECLSKPCGAFQAGTIRIYCGPYLSILNDADYIFTGSYSKNCPSIYDHQITGHGLSSVNVSFENMLFFNSHRFQTYRNEYFNVYGDKLANNETGIVIMSDTHLPEETVPFSKLNLPSNSNVFLLCGQSIDYWSPCSGNDQQQLIIDGSETNYMVVSGGGIRYVTWYGGNLFVSLFYEATYYHIFHLENTIFVDINVLETYDFYLSVSNIGIASPLNYLYFELYIGSPSSFALNCDYDSACGGSYLYANTGSYKNVPPNWYIVCYEGGFIGASPGCDEFILTFADGSKCELDPGDPYSTCKSWEKGTPRPTSSPSKHPSMFPTKPAESASSINTTMAINNINKNVNSTTKLIIWVPIIAFILLCSVGFVIFKRIRNNLEKRAKNDLTSELIRWVKSSDLSQDDHEPDDEKEIGVTNVEQLLVNELSKYQQIDDKDNDTRNVDLIDFNLVLDCYHDILAMGSSDEDIGKIFSESNMCNPSKCLIFRRHFRDRVQNEEKDMSNINENSWQEQSKYKYDAKCQILDTIHCFCYHHIMSMEENDIKEQKVNESDVSNILSSVKYRRNKKYNQLYTSQWDSNSFFRFGWEFKYERAPNEQKRPDQNRCIYVTRIYADLKTELTENNVSKVSMGQYKTEFAKAENNYNSKHMKSHISEEMRLEHILSLMFYCNYDSLQSEFSKTYRENNGLNHNQFYNLGKLLKEAVLKFGESIKGGKIKEFYHGITKKLIPIEIVGHLGEGVSIYCPLSTSSSKSVAINFTDNNNGLVMTFAGENSKAAYFSVDWISDYPNEQEQLFLQNKDPFQIENINDCGTGFAFATILTALKALDAILYESHYYEDKKSAKQKENKMTVIRTILVNQLSVHCSSTHWTPWKDLDPYAQKLLDVYFGNKSKLVINYSVLEQRFSDLFGLICLSEYEWIKLDILCAIFPNIKEIEIKNITLCDNIMKNIGANRFLFHHSNDSWNLRLMTIQAKKSSLLSGKEAVAEYVDIFFEHDQKLIIETKKEDNDEFYIVIIR